MLMRSAGLSAVYAQRGTFVKGKYLFPNFALALGAFAIL